MEPENQRVPISKRLLKVGLPRLLERKELVKSMSANCPRIRKQRELVPRESFRPHRFACSCDSGKSNVKRQAI